MKMESEQMILLLKLIMKTSNWNNLINSLRFATLGEELELNILTTSNKILNLKFETKIRLRWKSDNICT